MVAQQILVLLVMVRIHAGQPFDKLTAGIFFSWQERLYASDQTHKRFGSQI